MAILALNHEVFVSKHFIKPFNFRVEFIASFM